jgi:26S proteasome regulatory subunit N10
MVLEATVVCLDNSEWMRNGDYMPSRLEAQQDAVNLICAAKTQSNPESTVAVMTTAQSKNGVRAEVLVTLTSDLGKILSSLHTIKVGGEIDFSAGMQVAQLALKHRQNKNQHQRIVAFVGSPITESAEELVKLAKKLKKNNIAVDIVNFGEEAQNTEKLEAFINAVNTNEESHLVTVPPGPHILSDILLSSPVIVGEGGAGGFGAAAAAASAAAAAAGAGGDFGEFGVDPNVDPELALALRLSLEEERARQEAEAKRKAEEEGKATQPEQQQQAAPPAKDGDVEMASAEDEEELLKQAIAMSMGGGQAPSSVDTDMMGEDEQIQMALQMSMTEQQMKTDSSTTTTPAPDVNEALGDQDFLNSVLSSLPGVDPNDERIRSVLQSLKDKSEEKKDGSNSK